jgi:hypothetical protein
VAVGVVAVRVVAVRVVAVVVGSSLLSGLDISEGSRLQHLKVCRSVVGVRDSIGELGIDESSA